MRIILTILLLISSQSLRAAGIPVYVDRATMSEVQTGTNVSGRVVAGVIHTLSAEVAETVLTMNVLVGDSVKADEELARLDDTKIRNHLKSLKARKTYLTAHLALLEQRKIVREQQLARAESLNTRDLLTRDVTEQAELNLIQTESDLVKTRYELDEVNIQITDIERQLRQTRITAETAGRVITINVTEGEYVKPGDQLFRLLPDLGIEIEAEVRPEAYNSMSIGQIISGTLRHASYDLKVRALIAEQNQRTGSRLIRLQFLSPPVGNFVLGESIDLTLPIGKITDKITVAKDAVIPSKDGHRVVVIIDGKAEPRRVELGAGFGDRIVVTKGIRAGELVVTQGQDGLRKGQNVSVVGDQS
ncbi:MAG: efflux RND transporter periplasmic adaptor subunit [Pseudomonadota bacterium]|nr:efflux RND transporter periplasmic adaptor subunit [Pseudomonadota bacterium]